MDLTKKANAMRDKVRERVRSGVCVCALCWSVLGERESACVCVCVPREYVTCVYAHCI